MGYKIIHRMPIDGNTLITIEGQIKPIRIGDPVNNGKSTLLSIAMSDGAKSSGKPDKTALLVSGDFVEKELIY